MLTGKGIWTSAYKRFAHSTAIAGLSPTIQTIDIGLTEDTYFAQGTPTTNFDGNTVYSIGEFDTNANRAWIKPDFTSLPYSVQFLSATLKLTPTAEVSTNARTMRAHRCLRDVVSNQATWNIWKTANNWGTAGASGSGTDYEATEMGHSNTQISASPTLNVQLDAINFDAALLQNLQNGTYTNNGIVLFVDTQSSDRVSYASKDHATSAYRPIITITYY